MYFNRLFLLSSLFQQISSNDSRNISDKQFKLNEVSWVFIFSINSMKLDLKQWEGDEKHCLSGNKNIQTISKFWVYRRQWLKSQGNKDSSNWRQRKACWPAASRPSAWRNACGWPAPCCSQTPPAETACTCGSPASRRCRWRRPSEDTGWA